jgi:two-component system, NarL family, response regulator LiaR
MFRINPYLIDNQRLTKTFGMIKVVLFEDITDIRELLSEAIESSDELQLMGVYPNANEVMRVIQNKKPDVVLMDIQMPGITGIEAIRLIKEEFIEVQILVQTVFEDNAHIFAAICAGASGYILKDSSPERYVEAIIETYQGGSPMPPAIARKVLTMFQTQNHSAINAEHNELSISEKKVLDCLVKGMSYKLIADECKISFSTVNFHLKNIYRKLHVNSATEAIIKAQQRQLV